MEELHAPVPNDRLSQLSVGEGRAININRRYTAFIKSLRYILPLLAVVMTVVVVTWEGAGRRNAPVKKEELLPQSENIQNELLNPVFNSLDEKKQPYTVTADRAVQNRQNPDLIELEKPVATLTQNDGSKIDADAVSGLYEQKSQKLNLEGNVHLKHSNGYVLSTEELRVDMVAQKTYSGRDVFIEGPDGTLNATGLEGDSSTGVLIFTGPAKVVLYSDGKLLSPKEGNP